MRKPNSVEYKVLKHFAGDATEMPDRFESIGAGKKTFANMAAAGWIIWTDASEIGERGYRITKEGEKACWL